MRIIPINSVKGNELLAKDIIIGLNTVLMTSGTIVKKEYIKRLKEHNIEYIYVMDQISEGVNLTESLELQLIDQCEVVLRDVIQKYSFHHKDELENIIEIADEIISGVMNEPGVVYNLSSIRSKSESLYFHSLNVCALSVIISIKMKISKEKIRNIAVGSLLHDIGFCYISIDSSTVNLEKCSDKIKKEIKKHIIYGYSAIEKMKWLSNISKDIIIGHHERLDGSGYPFHLKEDRVKIGNKIVAVCDEFDSRVYGNLMDKMKVHDAIDYIVSQAGVLFDFKVVNAFVESVAAYPTGSLVITSDQEIGIVLKQNVKCPTRPIIRIIEDCNGNEISGWKERDLTKELTLFIVDTIVD